MPTPRLPFELLAEDPWSAARAARFHTAHGTVETPIFMPVATHAALRGLDTEVARGQGFQVLLANTYHLLLRPGPDLFRRVGGIHRFMDWPGTVLTDSGGFQIFSLSRHLKMSEEGARFRNYVDGTPVLLSPESSVATQEAIGSDIMMVLDHCIDATSDRAATVDAMDLTERWARRAYAARTSDTQALFGIVQGASFPDLRRRSAERICAIPFDGFAIGGLAVGETKEVREEIVGLTAPLLPRDKPRYLMGVGTPIDLLEAVRRGVDMFDCILPTQFAQQGVCFTSAGKIDLRRGIYAKDDAPLDPACGCATCARFGRSYLAHLIKAKEFIATHHLGVHNLLFYRTLMARMRQAILAGTFRAFYESTREPLLATDGTAAAPPVSRRKQPGPDRLGDYEVSVHASGAGRIRQLSSGEIMHSVNDPREEALELYVRQSGIREAAAAEGPELTVWDVGLGAGTNAMTCLAELEALPGRRRPVRIVSFERDLDPLRLALRNARLFPHVRHAAPHALLAERIWRAKTGDLAWELLEGDFLARMERAPAPDLIWYDPFSFAVDGPLWTAETFAALLSRTAGRRTALFTYSAATRVRAALLCAGWYVGAGAASGPKGETTAAFNGPAAAASFAIPLLGAPWLSRFARSGANRPVGATDDRHLDLVRNHPQFRNA